MNKYKINSFANQFLQSSTTGTRWLIFIAIGTVALLTTAPIFIIVYRYFPTLTLDIGVKIRIDLILSFLLVYIPIFTILRFFGKKIILGFVFSFILIMSILQLFNLYSFNQIKDSYLEIINYVETNPIKLPLMDENKMTIRNAPDIKQAVDYKNPIVRNFAVAAATDYFNEGNYFGKYGNIIRYFSIFKTINKWDYVSDPQGLDYFAKASESTSLLAGDCDDYAILMAACIKAVGGQVRLIHTKNHLYPEVNVGNINDLSLIYNLIKRKLFYKESMGYKIYYRVDSQNNVWLNFDYTGKYPGAKYMDDKILGILNI